MSLLNNRSGPNFLETGGGAEREATGRRAAASAGGTKLRIRSLRPDSSTASTASSRVNQRVSRSCRSGHCPQIGRSSCRGRGCQCVKISGVAVDIKKQQKEN